MTDQLARLNAAMQVPAAMPRHLAAIAAGTETPTQGYLAETDALYAAADAAEITARSERQAAYRANAWERCRPELFRTASLAGLRPQQDPRGDVSGWLDSPSPTLLLCGSQTQRGKTYAAYAVGNAARDRDLWVIAHKAVNLLGLLRPDDANPEIAGRTWAEVTGCDLLIIDDLGKEQGSAWTAEKLWNLIDERQVHRRRTVWTTNHGAEELARAYGDAFIGRLTQHLTIAKVEGAKLSPPPMW